MEKTTVSNMSDESLLSTYSLGDIAAEYNEQSARILNIIIDVTSGTTLFTASFIIYLIFYQTPPIMSIYKRYLLVNVVLEIITVTNMSLGKPRILLKYSISFTAGLLPIQQGFFTKLVYLLWYNTTIWSATCLTLIHIERYYTIHKGIKNTRFLGPKVFIYFYLIANTVITLSLVISGTVGDVYLDETLVPVYLKGINDGEDFFHKYPGALLFNSNHTVSTDAHHYAVVGAGIVISIPLFTFLLLNAFTGFKAIGSSNYSKRTKAIHATLLRVSMLQAMLLFVTGAIPVFLLLLSLVTQTTVVKMEHAQCFLNFYALCDNIVVLLFIKPYRGFILGLLKKNQIIELSSRT